jgi:hypothetical protein
MRGHAAIASCNKWDRDFFIAVHLGKTSVMRLFCVWVALLRKNNWAVVLRDKNSLNQLLVIASTF